MKKFLHEIKITSYFSVPFIGMLMAQKIMQLVSVIFLGYIGIDALAAGALTTSIYLIFIIFGIGILNVAGILIAQNKDSPLKVALILHHGFYVSVLMAIPCIILIWFLPEVLLFLGEKPSLVSLMKQFLHALICGFPALLGFSVLREFMAALHQQRITTIISFAIIPFHLLINYVFIKLLHFSIVGVGYANAITEWIMFVALGGYMLKQTSLRKYHSPYSCIQWSMIYKMLRIGLPSGITLSLEVGMSAILTIMMGYFGVIALAAHQIAFQCVTLAYMVPLGISLAMGLRVAQSANRPIFLVIYSGLITGAIFSLFILFLFLWEPNTLISFFIHPGELYYQSVKKLAILFLFIGSIFHFFDAQQGILMGCLRGLNDTFFPMLIAILTYLLIAIGGGYYLAFQCQLHGVGLWLGLALSLACTSLLLFSRMRHVCKYLIK